MFNWKTDKNYRLKHYNYMTDKTEHDFNVNFYNKILPSHHAPSTMYYPRFENALYEEDISRRSTLTYSPLLTSNIMDGFSEAELIKRREYEGIYSHQPDYKFFKMMLHEEVPNPRKDTSSDDKNDL